VEFRKKAKLISKNIFRMISILKFRRAFERYITKNISKS
jgi:hypothetical protein